MPVSIFRSKELLPSLTILVLSSDPYQPILKVWEKYFLKYWPDCPFNVISVCNHSHFKSNIIKFVKTGIEIKEDASHFKPMLLEALKFVNTKYILYMCEDQIINLPVNTENFLHLIEYMGQFNIVKTRCLSMPSPDRDIIYERDFINKENFGFIDEKNEYRNSLQAAVWFAPYFEELLLSLPGQFSGWIFETNESLRNYSSKYIYMGCKHGKGGTFLDRYEGMGDSPLLNYVELVRWGKFDRLYIEYFREMFAKDNFSVDTPEYEKFGAGKPLEWFPE